MSHSISDHLLSLFDYADQLCSLIVTNDTKTRNYFMTLVYIEDIIDSYGRDILFTHSSQNEDAEKSRETINRRLESLRKSIRTLSQMYNFDETLRQHSQALLTWSKSSEMRDNSTDL